MTVLFGNTPDAYVTNVSGIPTAGLLVALYTDSACTVTATGLTDEDGTASDSSLPAMSGRVPGSTVTSKVNGVLSFGAPDGTTRLYYKRGDGKASVLGPRADQAYAPVAAAWKATTAYVQDQLVVEPGGTLVRAKTNFTSGASYNAANWTAVAGGGSGSSGQVIAL